MVGETSDAMTADAAVPQDSILSALRDLVELGKPRITLMVLFTSAVGSWMAPGSLGVSPV